MTLSLGAVSALVGLLGMVWPGVLAHRGAQVLSGLLMLAVVLIQLEALSAFTRQMETWGWILAVLFQFLLVLSAWGLFRLVHGRPRLRQLGMALGLLVGGMSALGWLMFSLEEPATQVDRSHAQAVPISGFADGRGSVIGQARTDRGTPIRLWQLHEPMPWIQKEAAMLESVYAAQVIRLGAIDTTHTCHGWTFTGGKYLVSGHDIDLILKENGYAEVTEPAPGDVIIYRDEDGQVMHSGVVRVADGKGLTMIESKWDLLGRYLHAPDVQPYSQQFTYYRSSRSGHLLAGLEAGVADRTQ